MEIVYTSILFPDSITAHDEGRVPDCFHDLFLDQVVDAIVVGRPLESLKSFFYTELSSLSSIHYRHAIFRDMTKVSVKSAMTHFVDRMRKVYEKLDQSKTSYYPRSKQAWLLEAVHTYCRAVEMLAQEIASADVAAQGFLDFARYVMDYVASERFRLMARTTKKLRGEVTALRYRLYIQGLSVTVGRYANESDYREEVEETFSRFRHGTPKDYRVRFSDSSKMDHVQERIIGLVARLNPELFQRVDSYCAEYGLAFLDEGLAQFDREIQFYLTYCQFMRRFEAQGLKFCFPKIEESVKEIEGQAAFDLALAAKLELENRTPIPNDFQLRDSECILVVSGPNQGGKTTYARMIGQIQYLAHLGVPVPGQHARLFLGDGIFTYFDREESSDDARGKLQDDLLRIRDILDRATSRSLIILNEIFSSTMLDDARRLGRTIINEIIAKESVAIIVTFIDEWATLNSRTVSWVSRVDGHDSMKRTYKIVRQKPDGQAYARSIAEKYAVTYEAIKERMQR